MTDRRYDLHDKIAERDADWQEVANEYGVDTAESWKDFNGIKRMAEEILKLRDAVNGAGNLGLKWADELFEWKAYSAKLKDEVSRWRLRLDEADGSWIKAKDEANQWRSYSAKLREALKLINLTSTTWEKTQLESFMALIHLAASEALAIKPPGENPEGQ